MVHRSTYDDYLSKILHYEKIFYRTYENNVSINYSFISENEIELFLIESENKGSGNGSLALKECCDIS